VPNSPTYLVAIASGCACFMASVTSAAAREPLNCERLYAQSLENLRHRSIAPERRMALQQWAKRVYEACETGDMNGAEAVFERLDRTKF
jgi:hypothetical protein